MRRGHQVLPAVMKRKPAEHFYFPWDKARKQQMLLERQSILPHSDSPSDPASSSPTDSYSSGVKKPRFLGPNPKDKTYPLGNYPAYYSFRLDENGQDQRIKFMKEKWFQGKDVLDIGCNGGWLTLELAFKFGCNSMTGVDIDEQLVKDAEQNLKNRIQQTSSSSAGKTNDNNNSTTNVLAAPASPPIPSVVFRQEDFITSPQPQDTYHTVTCFSVTKWIHLNHGDHGIRKLFSKVHSVLHDGGYFILEPQAWSSYSNARDMNQTTWAHLQSIRLTPEDFPAMLGSSGFKLLAEFKIFDHANHSFNRIIYIFKKQRAPRIQKT